MIEQNLLGVEPVAGPETPAERRAARPENLEKRVSRLEEVVASLQDTRQLEERLYHRVSSQVAVRDPATTQEAKKVIVEASKQVLPAAMHLVRAGADVLDDQRGAAAPRRPWLLIDLYSEVRAIARMYVDRRYRVSWLAKVAPIVVLMLMLFSWFLFAGTFLRIGDLLDKIIDLLLAYGLYKILSREADNYRRATSGLSRPSAG